MSEQLPEFKGQYHLVKQAPARFKFNQEVNITVRPVFTRTADQNTRTLYAPIWRKGAECLPVSLAATCVGSSPNPLHLTHPSERLPAHRLGRIAVKWLLADEAILDVHGRRDRLPVFLGWDEPDTPRSAHGFLIETTAQPGN